MSQPFSLRSLLSVVSACVCLLLSYAFTSTASANENTTIGYQVSPAGTERLTPLGACSEVNPEPLFLKPGNYCIGNQQWSLTQGGKRFYQPTLWNRYYIVYSGNLESLLSAIAWGVSHGNNDNAKPVLDLATALKTRKLVMTCGKVSQLGQYLLKPLGIQSRLVSGLKMSPLNNYDDSHTLLEVKTPLGWQLVDLDNNRWFVDPITSGPLSALQVFNRVAKGESVQSLAKPLAIDAAYAPQGFIEVNNKVPYDYDFFSEDNLATASGLERWSQEVFSILGIQELAKDRKNGQNKFYFRVNSPEEQTQVLKTSKTYVPLSIKAFDTRFYGEPK